MALRDARRRIKPMLLAMSCVVLGVAAIVASFSFRDNLQNSVRSRAKSLLGADLVIQSREPFSAEAEDLLKSIGGEQSRQIGFSSMAFFPESGRSRLVEVRAIRGNFPYYGALETDPMSARQEFQSGANAFVDETVMLQFNAGVGDRLRIGDQDFRVAGKLLKIPGESLAFSLLNPRVYVPLAHFDQSQLIQKGSLVRYRVFFKLPQEVDPDQLAQRLGPELTRLRLEADTVSRRMAAISRFTDNLSRYLQLAVFIAVLLAGVGVASAVHVYVKEKTASVAVLRCIGATPLETVYVYLVQAVLIALAGSVLGALLGAGLQTLLPFILKDFLPVDAVISHSLNGILAGVVTGLGTTLLFALIPIVSLRHISPLFALRASYETGGRSRDPVLWGIFLIILLAIFAFALATTRNWLHGLSFTAAVLAAFGLLAFISRNFSMLLKKFMPHFLPFPWRQGLASLHRPNNQTTVVMLSIGLGAFLLITLYSVRSMLVSQVAERGGRGDANLVLFDVQKDQRGDVAALLRSFNVASYEEVPIVTMRLTAIKGRGVEEIRADTNSKIPGWALRREYRSTYRSQLAGTEKIVEGIWHAKISADTQPIPISLEKGIAENLQVNLGDELQFELQGVSLPTRVASIREVDWQRVQPNFFAVFPEGVLESAPQFYAVVTRAESSQLSASLQRAVVERFPNVSMIDLTLVLNTLDSILSRISSAIRFVAMFTILTGLAVLISAVLSSRAQRLKESILMKTLGAPRRQIVTAIVAEYLFLGAISCVTAVFLATMAAWGLSFYFLGTVASISWTPVVAIVAIVTGATVLAGVIGCWGMFHRSALEALRLEA
jgi:putative ABC transport system permease protein